MHTTLQPRRRQAAATLALTLGLLSGCGGNLNDALLTAVDPDVINPSAANSADGAEGLRVGALSRLQTMTGAAPANGDGVWFMSGMLVDEWKSGDTFIQRDETDKRTVSADNSIVTLGYRYIHRSRITADLAIAALRKYKPSPASNIAQMYFIRGYAELLSADNFCNGQPYSSVSTSGEIVEGAPVSVAESYRRAIGSSDTAIATIGGFTDAASLQVLNAARIAKARALMGLGGATNYASAAALLASVPTSYTFTVNFSNSSTVANGIWLLNNSAKRYVVSDSVDATGTIKNALPFVSAKDPRVPTSVPTSGSKTAFDAVTPFAAQLIFSTIGSPVGSEDPISVVNGLDARLIEAEVQLSQGNTSGWLTTLNALRTGPTVISSSLTVSNMAPLVDPVAPAARISLQFREKAFWTFGRGERLGDLRRLVRQYQRPQDQVFPTGTFFKGSAPYGTDVNLPVPQAEQNNSQFKGCTDRNA